MERTQKTPIIITEKIGIISTILPYYSMCFPEWKKFMKILSKSSSDIYQIHETLLENAMKANPSTELKYIHYLIEKFLLRPFGPMFTYLVIPLNFNGQKKESLTFIRKCPNLTKTKIAKVNLVGIHKCNKEDLKEIKSFMATLPNEILSSTINFFDMMGVKDELDNLYRKSSMLSLNKFPFATLHKTLELVCEDFSYILPEQSKKVVFNDFIHVNGVTLPEKEIENASRVVVIIPIESKEGDDIRHQVELWGFTVLKVNS
jgi:hypothetical protein